jgi:hypothetical protein
MTDKADCRVQVEQHAAGGFQLTMGVDQKSPSDDEYQAREEAIIATVNRYLADLAAVMADYAMTDGARKFGRRRSGGSVGVTMHQDGFAANLDVDELLLLGAVVKYAGIYGVPLTVIGSNRQTFRKPRKQK